MDEIWVNCGIYLKAAGILLTGIGGAGTGIAMGMRYRDRLRLLEDLQKMISLLKGEMLYANEPLEEAFFHVGEKKDSPLSPFFLKIAEKMEKREGESFYGMWKQEIEGLDKAIPLSKEDKRQLKDFGENLGYLDSAMQERTILLYQERLEGEITYLREHLREKNRLYASLGIAAGLFLIIVMC